MKKKKFFGTDGIRGKTNESFINVEFISDLAIALTFFFGRQKGSKKERLIIKAFQRRFRQDLINGKIDKECFLISKNLII